MEVSNCNFKDGEKGIYVSHHERQKTKDSEGGRFEGGRSEDMLSRMLDKVEGWNRMLKGMKKDISTLSHTIIYHSF